MSQTPEEVLAEIERLRDEAQIEREASDWLEDSRRLRRASMLDAEADRLVRQLEASR